MPGTREIQSTKLNLRKKVLIRPISPLAYSSKVHSKQSTAYNYFTLQLFKRKIHLIINVSSNFIMYIQV